MKVLLIGLGTVGEAIAPITRGRPWLDRYGIHHAMTEMTPRV